MAGVTMSEAVVTGLIALAVIVLLYKMAGFLLKLIAMLVILGVGYYYLSPVFGWPLIADLISGS
jgi:hypothetical protein